VQGPVTRPGREPDAGCGPPPGAGTGLALKPLDAQEEPAMHRIPPALWLLGLAVGVSLLTREPSPRAGPATVQVTRKAPTLAQATRPAAPADAAR